MFGTRNADAELNSVFESSDPGVQRERGTEEVRQVQRTALSIDIICESNAPVTDVFRFSFKSNVLSLPYLNARNYTQLHIESFERHVCEPSKCPKGFLEDVLLSLYRVCTAAEELPAVKKIGSRCHDHHCELQTRNAYCPFHLPFGQIVDAFAFRERSCKQGQLCYAVLEFRYGWRAVWSPPKRSEGFAIFSQLEILHENIESRTGENDADPVVWSHVSAQNIVFQLLGWIMVSALYNLSSNRRFIRLSNKLLQK